MCPTLSGSAYSVRTLLHAPELLYEDPHLTANVPVGVRKDLYFTLRVLKLPGVARLLLADPIRCSNGSGGTSTAFGNFFHSVMNEVRALKLAGLPNEAILRMATSDAAAALGIDDRVGTIEPGKLADLVLLDGNPVDDIEALGHVDVVMKEGQIVYRRSP